MKREEAKKVKTKDADTYCMEKGKLKKYLNWEGIINYTNSILDEYKLGMCRWFWKAYLQEEGIFFGYAYDILAIIEE